MLGLLVPIIDIKSLMTDKSLTKGERINGVNL